jgi:plastocyanin
MRLRRVVLLPVACGAGAAAAVLPSLAAGSSPPTTASFMAVDFAWEVSGSSATQATIAPGGTVTFGYPRGGSMHNADFGSGAQPTSCTQTAPASSGPVPPLPHQPAAPGWSGTCTFDTPGTYTFHCDLHPFMTGTIVVSATTTTSTTTTGTTTTGTTTTTTTGTTTGTTATTTTGTTTATTTTGSPPTGPTPTSTQGTTTAQGGAPLAGGSPLAGAATRAIRIVGRQRGTVLRGSLTVSAAGAGGRLEVDLLATRAALTGLHGRGLALVGRLVRFSLPAGVARFSIALDAAARRALGLHGRLALAVRVTLVSPRGVRASVSRTVILLRPRA